MSPCSTKTRCCNLISYCFFDTPVGQLELDKFVESSQDVFCSVVFLRGSSVITKKPGFLSISEKVE